MSLISNAPYTYVKFLQKFELGRWLRSGRTLTVNFFRRVNFKFWNSCSKHWMPKLICIRQDKISALWAVMRYFWPHRLDLLFFVDFDVIWASPNSVKSNLEGWTLLHNWWMCDDSCFDKLVCILEEHQKEKGGNFIRRYLQRCEAISVSFVIWKLKSESQQPINESGITVSSISWPLGCTEAI